MKEELLKQKSYLNPQGNPTKKTTASFNRLSLTDEELKSPFSKKSKEGNYDNNNK